MDLHEVTFSEYRHLFQQTAIVFDSVEFSELNRNKCINVHYLTFRDSKLRFGLIVGERDDVFCCPFSAPFSILESNKIERIEHYEEAVIALKKYMSEKSKPLRVILPPTIYGSVVAKMFSAFVRENARIIHTDLNYHYKLDNFVRYSENLERSARKNFHNSEKIGFMFSKVDSDNDSEVERAYRVIEQNRRERGFPLRMSLQDVCNTIKIISADFFVMTYNGIDVAAAQVFHVANDIAQVIYWGDLPSYSHLRTMNYFTYKVFEYYSQTNIRLLDIGPSTEDGIPNYGLCEFKENIGCEVTLKHTLQL